MGDRRTHQGAGIGDQHDPVLLGHRNRRHQTTVTFTGLDGNHALPAAPMHRVVVDRGTLAEAVFSRREHLAARLGHDQRNDALTFAQTHAAHAGRRAAHGADIPLMEADGLARIGEQHDVAVAIGNGRTDQAVALADIHGNDTAGTRP